jgi:hypothetical protein
MTKKTKAVNLKSVVPTAEEQEAAKKKRVAMDAKAKMSIKASVRHFVKTCKEDNPDTIGAKGDIADSVIDKWLVHLTRCMDGDKSVSNERCFEKANTKFADLHWYNCETLGTTFGPNRAKYWLEEKLLPIRPDRISGKHGE